MQIRVSHFRNLLAGFAAAFVLGACGGAAEQDQGETGGVGDSVNTDSGTFILGQSGVSVDEDAGSLDMIVRRVGGSRGVVNVQYETIEYGPSVTDRATAMASGSGDFGPLAGGLRFAEGETRKTVTVQVSDDGEAEGDKVFGFRLTGVDRGRLGEPASSRVTIIDDDQDNGGGATGQFQFSQSSYSVAEDGNTLTVRVDRVGGSRGAASVRYSTSQYDPAESGNADDVDFGNGDDYQGTTGQLDFADGQTEASFQVAVTDDAEFTGNLAFGVYLFEASTSLGTPAEAAVTIVDDERPPETSPGAFRLSGNTYSVSEDAGGLQVTVRRVNGSDGEASVDYTTYTTGGSAEAVAGSDFAATSGTLTFADGQTQRSFSVGIVDDDEYRTEALNFGVRLSGSSTSLASPSEAVVSISEDDAEPGPTGEFQLGASSYYVSENGGSVRFVVQRVNGSDGAASVDFATAVTGTGDGHAAAGEDYTSASGTLAFADGETERSFSVSVVDDDEYTGALSFAVRLSNAETALGSPSQATVQISDDEEEPTESGEFRFDAASYSVAETGGSITITVERVNGSTGAVSVDFATQASSSGSGDAVAGTDFQSASGTLDFADGVTTRSFQVSIIDDASYTGDLSFGVSLSNADTTVVSPDSATVTIVEDEQEPSAPTLVWDAPTTNADGSCINDLDGFRVNYGLSSGDYSEANSVSLDDLQSTSTGNDTSCGEVVSYQLPLDSLDSASWYITVQSRDVGGNLSEHSEEIVVTIE